MKKELPFSTKVTIDLMEYFTPHRGKGEDMKCPKCGSAMTLGASHADYGSAQWECHNCGYCVVV